jgi:DNA-binding transcriptional LysR family regulator
MSITLDQLQALVTVEHCGSFSRAADLLKQSPSYISRKISRLEQQLGIRLFTRTTRKLSLTEEGYEVLIQAQHAMRIIDNIEDNVLRKHHGPQGKLKIDAASPFLEQCIIPYITDYQQTYPKVDIELSGFNRVVDLIENQIDIAFRIGELRDSSLHYKFIGRSKLRILASPSYIEKYGEPSCPKSLDQHRCLGFSQPLHLNLWPLDTGDKSGFLISSTLKASSGSAIRQLALQGAGIACLAGFMTRDDVRSGLLVPVLGNHLLDSYQPINAVFYRGYNSSMKVKSFVEFIRQAMKNNLD